MVVIALIGILLAGPLDPPTADDPCQTTALELKWTDIIAMGNTARQLTRPACQIRLDAYGRFGGRMMQPQIAGHWRLGAFRLAGENVGFGFDMVWGSEEAFHGRLDGYRGPNANVEQVLLVPTLYLPEPWQRALDTATTPVLVLGGAAITTWVIIEMMRSASQTK
jgi:hypothetical protein